VIAFLLLFAAQTELPPCANGQETCKPWDRQWSTDVNPYAKYGPHTLVISDGNAMTQFNYKTGTDCERARTEVMRQLIPHAGKGWTVYAPMNTKVFCVPR
jgi:hypothetical protein